MEEEQKYATMEVVVDPDTGENKILGRYDKEKVSFDDMVKKINSNDSIFDDVTPISETDVIDYISGEDNESILNKLKDGTNMSDEDMKMLMDVINRRIKKEEFNVYKALPPMIRKAIDEQALYEGINTSFTRAQINSYENMIAKNLIDEFVNEIQINKAKSDFALQLHKIYESANAEISTASLELLEERNKAYREAADQIEDEDKREKLKAILDRIDETRSLSELKEFSKKCKIKHIELEKPDTRVFSSFISKYQNSSNNIYDINLAKKMLVRNMCNDKYQCSVGDINAFLIAFCKQVAKYDVNNVLDHAYMYYVLYNCALLDGDKSDTFRDNVFEVIKNLRECNVIRLVPRKEK